MAGNANPTIGVQGNTTPQGPGAAGQPQVNIDLSNINAQLGFDQSYDVPNMEDIVFNAPSEAPQAAAAPAEVARTEFRAPAPSAAAAAPVTASAKPLERATQAAAPLTAKPANRPAPQAAASGYSPTEAGTPAEGGNEVSVPKFQAPQIAPGPKPGAAETAPKPRVTVSPTTDTTKTAPVPENYVQKLEPTPESKMPSPLVTDKGWTRKRGRRAKEYVQKQAKAGIEHSSAIPSGNDVVTKLAAGPNADLGYEDVSLGSNVILAAIRQPGSIFLNRVNAAAASSNAGTYGFNEYLKDTWGPEEFTGMDAEANMEILMQQVNKMNLWVTMCKSPTSEPESYQARRLRIHEGDGIMVNPLAAKAFNADFDGDGAQLHLSGKNLQFARRAVEYLINTDGKPTIDDALLYAVTTDDYMYDLFVREFASVTLRSNDIANAYIKYTKDGDLAAMLRTFGKIAGDAETRLKGDRLDALAGMVDILYSTIKTLKQLDVENTLRYSGFVEDSTKQIGANVFNLATEDGMNPAEAVVTKIWQEAKEGKMPPNYPQFIAEYGNFLGQVDGKNNHFRLGANVANLIKRSSKIYMGEQGFYDLWHDTVAGTVSIAMNAKIAAGEKKRSDAEWLRASILAECGLPGQWNSLEQWARKFRDAWNKYTAFLNTAGTSVTTSFEMLPDEKYQPMPDTQKIKLDDLVKPFIKIYGEFTIGALFGNHFTYAPRDMNNPATTQYDSWVDANNAYFVLSKYKHITLEKFCHNNHMWITPNVRTGNVIDSPNGWRSLLEACADSQRAAATAWNTTLRGTKNSPGMLDALKEMLKNWDSFSAGENSKYDNYVKECIDILSSTQPAMFLHFNMDNPNGFRQSEYGNAIRFSDGSNLLSIRFAMVYEWRTARLRNVQEALRKADEVTSGELREQLRHEQSVLASSSPLWDMLLKEARTGNKNWKRYMDEKSIPRKQLNGDRIPSEARKVGFFSAYPSNKWDTIKDFVLDTTVPDEMKEAVLRDMTVADGGFVNTLTTEMAYQFECDPTSSYSGLNNSGYNAQSGNPIKAAKDDMVRVNDRFTREYTDRFSPKKRADGSIDNSGVDRFESFMEDYRENGIATDIPVEIYMDLVFADKESNDKEKGGQAAQTNAGYNSLVEALDGGHTTELRTVDSQALGRISWQDLTRKDLLDAMAGVREIRFFDEYGHMCTLDENFELDFERYPRLCALFQFGRTDVNPDPNGTITVVGTGDAKENIPDSELINLMNHPGFAGLIALFTPRHNTTTFNSRAEGRQTMNALIDTLQWYAYETRRAGRRPNLSKHKVIKALNARDDDYKKWHQNELAQKLGDEVVDLIQTYSMLVTPKEGAKNRLDTLSFDVESIGSYGDTQQRVSGSKTATSTGKEGAETKRHELIQGYFAFSRNARDVYRDSAELSNEDQIRLEQAQAPTNLGVPYTAGLECVVFDSEYFNEDPTMREGKMQTNVMSRFYVSKRSNSGEAHNLKIRKAGLIGGDRVIKNRKYQQEYEDWPDFEAAMQEKFAQAIAAGIEPKYAIEAIRWELAKRLEAVDSRLDYDNLEPYEYMEPARWMCVENEGKLVFRSLDQISTTLVTRMEEFFDVADVDWNDIKNEDAYVDAILNACDQIIETVGFEEANVDVHSYLMRIGVPRFNDGKVHTAKRKWSSSLARNLQLLEKIGTVMPTESRNKISAQNVSAYKEHHFQQALKKSEKHREETQKEFEKRIREIVEQQLGHTFDSYKLMGFRGNNRASSGSENVILLSGDMSPQAAIDSMRFARDNYMTVFIESTVFNDANFRQEFERYAESSFPVGGFTAISFFERELNGYGETQSSSFWLPNRCIEWTVEDEDGRFTYADANIIVTQHHMDNITIEDEGVHQLEIDRMFANTWERFDGMEFLGYRLATVPEIQNEVNFWNLDLGVNEANNNFDAIQQKTKTMVNEFYSNWNGETRWLLNAKPDHVIGFMVCGFKDPFDEKPVKVFAPIVPFVNNRDGKQTAPAEFDCVPRYNPMTGTVDVHYRNTSNLVNRFVKKHEGDYPASKEIMFGDAVEDMSFANGVHIDDFVWVGTTGNRLVGDNKRIATLTNLFYEQYEEEGNMAYNLALDAESFPGQNPDEDPECLKAKLAAGIVPMDEWYELPNDMVYHADPDVNAFIRVSVKKCLRRGVNPSLLLANQYMTENGLIRSRMAFEWKTIMETSFDWEDAFLKFMHTMNPDLCPYGIRGSSEGCLYKVDRSKGNYGVLKKWVPYPGKGKKGTWCIVRAGFGMFGEDSSATKMPGFTGEIELQSLIENSHGGNWEAGTRLKYFKHALAGLAPSKLRATTQDVREYRVERLQNTANVIAEMYNMPYQHINKNKKKEPKGEPIDSFRGEYSFLSNFHRCNITLDGVTYTSAEAAFQAQKDPSRAAEFARMTPDEAKRAGRNVRIDVNKWNSNRDNAMMRVLKAKFEQNPDLADKLRATGNSDLIEGNTWGDKYWGVSNGEGENKLGSMLMQIRNELKNG